MRSDKLTTVEARELALEVNTQRPLPTARDLVSILFRQWRPIVIAFALVVVAVAMSGVWIPTYEAKVKFLALHKRSNTMVTSSADAPAQLTNDQVSEEDLNSEVELLNSDDLLRNVVLATGLSGQSVTSDSPARETKIAIAMRKLSSDLKIEPIRKTNVISVTYHSHDPWMAKRVLQALAAAYTEKYLDVHHSSSELTFFDEQAKQYKQNLNQAQEKLTDFTRGTGVVSAELERDAALRQAEQFDSTARQAQTDLLTTEHRVNALQTIVKTIKPRITTVVRNSDNAQLLEQQKSTLLNLELKKTELLSKFQPTYPLVQETEQQISEVKNSINAEESKPIRDESTDQNPDYQWAQAELTRAQADLSSLKERAGAAAAVAAKYHAQATSLDQSNLTQQNLLQAAKTQEDNYRLYQQKREEARISNALDQNGILNVALTQQPFVPALPTRSVLSVALLTLIAATIFSLSIGFLLDFMDSTFRTPDELVIYLGAPVLAALPKGGD